MSKTEKLTTSKAKKVVSAALQEQGFDFQSLKAQTISFGGFGYGKGIFVKPIGIRWPEPHAEVPDKFQQVRNNIATVNRDNGWDGNSAPKIVLDL